MRLSSLYLPLVAVAAVSAVSVKSTPVSIGNIIPNATSLGTGASFSEVYTEDKLLKPTDPPHRLKKRVNPFIRFADYFNLVGLGGLIAHSSEAIGKGISRGGNAVGKPVKAVWHKLPIRQKQRAAKAAKAAEAAKPRPGFARVGESFQQEMAAFAKNQRAKYYAEQDAKRLAKKEAKLAQTVAVLETAVAQARADLLTAGPKAANVKKLIANVDRTNKVLDQTKKSQTAVIKELASLRTLVGVKGAGVQGAGVQGARELGEQGARELGEQGLRQASKKSSAKLVPEDEFEVIPL